MPATPRVRSTTVESDGLQFDCLTAGPRDGQLVVLLHGFPQTAECWRDIMRELATAGYRCVAPTQRGYSPGARPREVSAYATDRLVGDALDIAAQSGAGDGFHVVGHDLGGLLVWLLAVGHPHLVRSATVLSTPHPAAFARAMLTSTQPLRSAYIPMFRIPVLPERVLSAADGAVLRLLLRGSGLHDEWAARYASALATPEAMGAALNWYRGVGPGVGRTGACEVPTLYVWSSGDVALTRTAAEQTRAHVRGRYRFEVIDGGGHWLPEMHAPEVARLLLRHLRG
jgi:pimeloyl-ACP methyl ester carboxylesterase